MALKVVFTFDQGFADVIFFRDPFLKTWVLTQQVDFRSREIISWLKRLIQDNLSFKNHMPLTWFVSQACTITFFRRNFKFRKFNVYSVKLSIREPIRTPPYYQQPIKKRHFRDYVIRSFPWEGTLYVTFVGDEVRLPYLKQQNI